MSVNHKWLLLYWLCWFNLHCYNVRVVCIYRRIFKKGNENENTTTNPRRYKRYNGSLFSSIDQWPRTWLDVPISLFYPICEAGMLLIFRAFDVSWWNIISKQRRALRDSKQDLNQTRVYHSPAIPSISGKIFQWGIQLGVQIAIYIWTTRSPENWPHHVCNICWQTYILLRMQF